MRLLFAADMNNIPKLSVCIILELSSTFILSDDRVSWTPQYSSYKRNQNGKVGGFDLFIFRQSENPKIKSPEKYNVWAPFLKLQHDYFGRFWKARTCKLLWNYHFQDEHWPGADNPLWQHAHQCYQAWRKAYVGRCLKSFYIFNQLVVCFLIILIVKIIWESTTLRSGGIDFQRIGQFLGEIVQILWPSKVFENQTLLSLWKLSNTLIKYWSVT